jgi:hypothetical protein
MIEENRRYTKAEKANLDVEHLPFLDADVLESLPVEEARR